MLAFPSMLVPAARQAGIKTPELPISDDYDADAYPHFAVFCGAQLGRLMSPGAHWENAKIIAGISDELIREINFDDLLLLGWTV